MCTPKAELSPLEGPSRDKSRAQIPLDLTLAEPRRGREAGRIFVLSYARSANRNSKWPQYGFPNCTQRGTLGLLRWPLGKSGHWPSPALVSLCDLLPVPGTVSGAGETRVSKPHIPTLVELRLWWEGQGTTTKYRLKHEKSTRCARRQKP